jgi:hypothetical protein
MFQRPEWLRQLNVKQAIDIVVLFSNASNQHSSKESNQSG